MDERNYHEERDYPPHDTRPPGAPPGAKKDFEEKLDDVAERVSRTVSEGAKRIEEAAARVKDRPEFSEGRVKRFFTSPMGGVVVTIVGVLWFFNAVGFFENWVLALVVTGVGVYMIYRFKSNDPKP